MLNAETQQPTESRNSSEMAQDGTTDGFSKKDVYRFAGEAFDLIHKYSEAPTPMAFEIWFKYASGSDKALTSHIDGMIETTGLIYDFELKELYDLFIADKYEMSTRKEIGQGFEHSIAVATALIEESVKHNNDYSESLEAVGVRLPSASTPDDLQEMVGTLLSENQKMCAVTQQLSAGLNESKAVIQKLNRELEEVQSLSLSDSLTGTANRRAFDQRLATEIQNAELSEKPFSLAIVDIDFFKKVNDTYGHQAGDEILKGFAALLTLRTKGGDMVARYGGEEFAIILPSTGRIPAHNLMINILHELRETRFPISSEGKSIAITASFGIAAHKPGMQGNELIELADEKLYEAKQTGRNRVKTAGLS